LARPIDLLTEPALVNPYLRRQIESEKRALYPST
jgi:predicted nucleotidyltransferase